MRVIEEKLLEDVLQKKLLRYDNPAKSTSISFPLSTIRRNSDPDAALYWLARMLESGEDPLYLARRMVRMAKRRHRPRRTRRSRRHARRKGRVRFSRRAPKEISPSRKAVVYLSLAPNPTPFTRLTAR